MLLKWQYVFTVLFNIAWQIFNDDFSMKLVASLALCDDAIAGLRKVKLWYIVEPKIMHFG